MVEKIRKFFKVRSSLQNLELQPDLATHQVNDAVSEIEESGVYKRHFWKNLANLVDYKAQVGGIKNRSEGETIDLAYRVEI